MFSPNVLSRDNIIVVEAFLNDGNILDPFLTRQPSKSQNIVKDFFCQILYSWTVPQRVYLSALE